MWSLIGRARTDLSFHGRLQNDLDKTIEEEGYKLEPDELAEVRRILSDSGQLAASYPASGLHLLPPEIQSEMVRSAVEMRQFAVEMIKGTFNSARSTYHTIMWMNRVMFAVGIAMFIFAALWAAFSSEKVYSVLFGGLGAASFIALFLLKPMENAQKALSNLVQIEIAFMEFTDQISWWENLASIPKGMPPMPDPANIEKASKGLQEVARDTIAMVQKFLVPTAIRGERSLGGLTRSPRSRSKATESIIQVPGRSVGASEE